MKPHNPILNIAETSILNPAKSSRLAAMRAASLATEPTPSSTQPSVHLAHNSKLQPLCPELVYARQLIDQCIAEIMAWLPAGKQKRLFKIRFGVELEAIYSLPITQSLQILKISEISSQKLTSDMKRLSKLNYNGQAVE